MDQRSEDQVKTIQLSNELAREFLDADVIALGVPMYNLSIPSTLKAYIDHLSRVGLTFQYTENGPQGLVKDKPVYVLTSRGGIYDNNPYDFQTPYLKGILNFPGINDITFINTDGMSMDDDTKNKGIQAAIESIDRLVAAGRFFI